MADHHAHLRASASTSKLLVDKTLKLSSTSSVSDTTLKKRDPNKRKSWEAGQEESVVSFTPDTDRNTKEKPKEKAEPKDKPESEPAKTDDEWLSSLRKYELSY